MYNIIFSKDLTSPLEAFPLKIGPVELESTLYDWKSFSLPLTYEPCLPFFLNLETTSLINFDPPGIDNYQPLGNLLQRYLKFTMKQVEFFDNDKFE